MSGINGDKARFHRERKQKLARRERMQKFLKGLATSAPPAATASSAKPKAMAQ
jgi:hypothetical protein